MGHKKGAAYESAVFCRASDDLKHWSEPVMVAAGGEAATQTAWFGGSAECPFVVQMDGIFYLSRTQRYGRDNLSTVDASRDPLCFGVGNDHYRIGMLPVAAPEIIHYKGQWHIAALNPALDGIRLARLRWVSQPSGPRR